MDEPAGTVRVWRRAMLVALGWCAAALLVCALVAAVLPGDPEDCVKPWCLGDDTVFEFLVVLLGLPTMVIGLFVGSIVVAWAARRVRTSWWLGTGLGLFCIAAPCVVIPVVVNSL